METDPPIVLVTGWNEWIAGRWQGIPERPPDVCGLRQLRVQPRPGNDARRVF
ncbi:MAG: hypothetical protein L6V84_01695 [Oscillospiraceae bacterium]|nr:MAG: hypothetical protein L6V84_01695 [Oscillospiraceae bacterium]